MSCIIIDETLHLQFLSVNLCLFTVVLDFKNMERTVFSTVVVDRRLVLLNQVADIVHLHDVAAMRNCQYLSSLLVLVLLVVNRHGIHSLFQFLRFLLDQVVLYKQLDELVSPLLDIFPRLPLLTLVFSDV